MPFHYTTILPHRTHLHRKKLPSVEVHDRLVLFLALPAQVVPVKQTNITYIGIIVCLKTTSTNQCQKPLPFLGFLCNRKK